MLPTANLNSSPVASHTCTVEILFSKELNVEECDATKAK